MEEIGVYGAAITEYVFVCLFFWTRFSVLDLCRVHDIST